MGYLTARLRGGMSMVAFDDAYPQGLLCPGNAKQKLGKQGKTDNARRDFVQAQTPKTWLQFSEILSKL